MEMAGNYNKNKNERVLLIVLVVLIVVSLTPIIFNKPQILPPSNREITIPQPDDIDWELITLNKTDNIFKLSSQSVTVSQTNIDTSQFPMPDPNLCKQIKEELGFPCQWEAEIETRQSGTKVAKVRLRSGENILAEGESIKTDLSKVANGFTIEGHTQGWVPILRVAKWVEKLGFGRLVWKAMDKTVVSEYGESVIVFIDTVGWAPTLLRNIPYIKTDLSVYVYVTGG